MNNKVAKLESKFTKCIKAPFRVLCKARDFYVRSLTDCSGQMSYGGAVGQGNNLPRSYSVTSSTRSNDDEDLRELIREASQKGLVAQLEMEIRKQRQQQPTFTNKLPRSFTVGIGRIDEDKVYDFEDEYTVVSKPELLYPRSKSVAATKRTSYVY
ncbi:hypothetical protein ACHQM5_024833 [Ranunculus cassubicifolius]